MGFRVLSPAAALCAAALLAGCGGGQGPASKPRPRPAAKTHDPGYQVSSEALAGHPTPTPPRAAGCPRHPHEQPLAKPTWLGGVQITEYFPTPEYWFVGRRVSVPGLSGRHRADWLYSSAGVAMQGIGLGLDGKQYSIDNTGAGTWVNANGAKTIPNACASRWSQGSPAWLTGGWRNARGAVTFPLESGGWSNGAGRTTASYQGVTFVQKGSPSVKPYHTVAVDPGLIPLGSRIYIPSYKPVNGGWFVAGDTGGAIIGRHVDVYRPPTAIKDDGGRYLVGQRIYVLPPGR